MYPATIDEPNPAPLDFNTDRTVRGVADAPGRTTGASAGVSPPDAESLLAELGLSGHLTRRIVAERSGPGAWE